MKYQLKKASIVSNDRQNKTFYNKYSDNYALTINHFKLRRWILRKDKIKQFVLAQIKWNEKISVKNFNISNVLLIWGNQLRSNEG